MASLYRPRYTKVDPKTGERVTTKVRKWYGRYRDADGVEQRVPLSQDKQAAQAMLTDIVRRVEQIKAGVVDAVVERLKEPVDKHVSDFKTHLEANARSESHISETIRLIKNIVDECRLQVLADLQGADDLIERHLLDRRRAGVSHRTVNADLAAIRAFCRWLMKRERIHRDPTTTLQPLNVEEDRRLQRRALSDEEAAKLIRTALASKEVYRNLTGPERAYMYMLCQRTGLRRKELRSLRVSSFDFSQNPAIVTVQAAHSKHRRLDRLPLPDDIAAAMQRQVSGKDPDERIWPGAWWRKSAEMLRRDLKAAGIEPKDATGRVVDFHGQRTTFITCLARAGVPISTAQKLARHSDVNLTLGTYARLTVGELAAAVDKLPKFAIDDSPEVDDAPMSSRAETIDETDLERVVAAWHSLTSEVRSAILKLVENRESETN